jgi:integrase
MTVWYDKRSKAYRYHFQYLGRRVASPRGFPTRREALDAEAERRRLLRRQAAGLETDLSTDSPHFQEWAEIYLLDLERRGRPIEAVTHVLRVVLRFFGRTPDRPLEPHEAGPYHDYRLIDPVLDPGILDAFDAWMHARGIAGATRNRYRSAVSQLYVLARRPRYRLATGIRKNPMRGVERDLERGRSVVLTREQLRAILDEAPRHLWLAVMIAALAPALRLGNILALRWDTHVSPDLRLITVTEHKTAGRTGRPIVTPVSDPLHAVLTAVKAAQRKGAKWVVTYRGRPVKTIDTGLKLVCQRVGVPYGRTVGGVTFHTIRHSAATWMAALGIPEALRKDAIGHASIAMTQEYTHLAAAHLVAPLTELASHLQVVRPVVQLPRLRSRRQAQTARSGTADADADRGNPQEIEQS